MAEMKLGVEALEKIFKSYVENLRKIVKNKLNDNNNSKAFSVEGHQRLLTLPGHHRLTFMVMFSNAFNDSDEVVEQKDKKFISISIETMERLGKLLSFCNFVRHHKNGDITIIAPWGVIDDDEANDDHDDGNIHLLLEKNTFFLPIKDEETYIKAFVPCGGPDPETDELPRWSRNVRLDEIVPLSSISIEKVQKIASRGTTCEKISRGDDYFICMAGQIEVGDFVQFNGERVRAAIVGTDFMSDSRDCITVEEKFKKDHKLQNFKIIKLPILQGWITNVKKTETGSSSVYHPVTFSMSSPDENIGIVQISFQNFCFNSIGFLTHDTACSER